MGDDGKDILDMMLDDSSNILKKELGRPEHVIREMREREQEPEPEPEPKEWPEDPELLQALTDKDLRTWLAALKPGDLLCVVAEGSEALRQRIMGQLDGDSIKWLKGNLELWDPPTNALLNSSREAVCEAARELIGDGKIAKPDTAEQLEQTQDEAKAGTVDELTKMLIQIVAVAHTKGAEELGPIVDELPHPLLKYGLSSLLEGADEDALAAKLTERRQALEAAYGAELELVRQAVLAIAKGTDPKTFFERVKTARGR